MAAATSNVSLTLSPPTRLFRPFPFLTSSTSLSTLCHTSSFVHSIFLKTPNLRLLATAMGVEAPEKTSPVASFFDRRESGFLHFVKYQVSKLNGWILGRKKINLRPWYYNSENRTVDLPRGPLEIEWRKEDNHVYMTGPAQEVYYGSVPLRSLSQGEYHSFKITRVFVDLWTDKEIKYFPLWSTVQSICDWLMNFH